MCFSPSCYGPFFVKVAYGSRVLCLFCAAINGKLLSPTMHLHLSQCVLITLFTAAAHLAHLHSC
jgi:hypothetical protein